ncbi:MAG: hypothetical protein AAGC92_12450 [Pseudomonadota bacterium]
MHALPKRRAAARISAAALALALLCCPWRAEAVDQPFWDWAGLSGPCRGDCRVTVFAGQFLDSTMSDVFLPFDSDYTPPWDLRFREDYMLSLALSRRIATVGGRFDIEIEGGLGQRFGEATVTEGWVALYGRWTAFPWNDVVRTSIAVSTGLNYATAIPDAVLQRSAFGTGNRLLHYFSPEFTLADPAWDSTDLVLRLHHRSGGGKIWGDVGPFGGVAEGAQYLKLGLRHRF